MKEEIYQWMKNLAVFYILFTAVLHLVPDKVYERYVRFFMGLLLIFMLCVPAFSILGQSARLTDIFLQSYEQEDTLRTQKDAQNLQELYLERGYGQELENQVSRALQERKITFLRVEAALEEDRALAVIYMEKEPDGELKGEIADGLKEACGLGEGDYQIQTVQSGEAAVGSASAGGASAGGDRHAGVQ